MHWRVPDISKVKEMIGWSPTRRLDEINADVASAKRAAPAR
jgi:hypothetical protein